MRLQFTGKLDKQTILNNIAQLLNEYSDAGIEEFFGVNFYLNPIFKNKASTTIVIGNNKNDDTVTISGTPISEKTTVLKKELSTNAIHKRSSTVKLLIPERKRQTILSKRKQEYEEKLRKHKETREKEKEFILKCKKIFLSALDISSFELTKLTKSSGWIRTLAGIEKYTSEKIGNTAYRFTLCYPNNNDVIYLFPTENINQFIVTTKPV